MIRCRRLVALATLIGCGAMAPHLPAHADSSLRITDISVGVSAEVATYYLCVAATSAPIGGGVAVLGLHGQTHATFGRATQQCGAYPPGAGATYLMTASFAPLPAGQYTFQAACVTTNDGTVSCVNPNSAFTLFATASDAVAALCQVNFDPSVPTMPRNCTRGQQGAVQGDLAMAVPPLEVSSGPGQGGPFHTYFAEGFTGGTTREYLILYNPASVAAQALVTVYPAGHVPRTTTLVLPAYQRRTLDIAALAPRASVAIGVEANHFLAVERAMYVGSGGHAAGSVAPSMHWVFTHVLVGTGYAEWLPLLNPEDQPATVTATLVSLTGTTRVLTTSVAPRSRVTLDVSRYLGGAMTRAITVAASVPLVAEYAATVNGGESVLANQGTRAPSVTWYFAQARTDGGRLVYLPVSNPGNVAATVTLTLVLNDGSWLERTARVAAHGMTVFALHHLVHSPGLSATVRASVPVSVEESAYLGNRRGGALIVGVAQPATTWYCAEGYTGSGFQEQLALYNPDERAARVRVRYTTRSGATIMKVVRVPARGRVEWWVNADVPPGSVAVAVSSDQPVVVGRSMNFHSGWGITLAPGVSGAGYVVALNEVLRHS